MKKFKFILTAMLLTCSTMSFAQFMNNSNSSITSPSSEVTTWKGLLFSYDRTFMSTDYEDVDDTNLNGFSIDYVQSFKLSNSLPLFIETGAGISFARWSDSETEEVYGAEYTYKESLNTLALNIPINIVYGININNTIIAKPFTGLYLKANLMGNITAEESYDGESESETYNLFDEDDMGKGYTWNRIQIGWQIGTMFDINDFNIGIAYSLDFNEIAKKQNTSKFSIRLGYNF